MKQATLTLLACVGLALPASAQSYDLVINGGRVMDPETMYDDIANVGVKDGRIAAITKEKIAGKDTIDAKGLVVAPGFRPIKPGQPFSTRSEGSLRTGRAQQVAGRTQHQCAGYA